MMESNHIVPLSKQGLLAMRPKKVFPSQAKINSLEFSLDGLRLLSAADNGWLTLYDVNDCTSIRVIGCTKYGVGQAIFGAHPEIVLHTATKVDNNIRYMSMHDNRYLIAFTGHTDKVTNIEFNPTKDSFMSCSLDNSLRMWDVRQKSCTHEMQLEAPPVGAYDPEGVVFAVGINSNMIKLYDIRNFDGGPFQNFTISNVDNIRWSQIKFSRAGTFIIISTNSNKFTVMDSFNAEVIHTFNDSKNDYNEFIYGDLTGDQIYGLYGGSDSKVHVYSTKEGKEIGILNSKHSGTVTHVLFNQFYSVLATAGSDGLELWS